MKKAVGFVSIVVLVFFSIGYFASFLITEEHIHIPETNIIRDAQEGGLYLTMVYFGSSFCQASNNKNNHEAIKDIKDSLRVFANSRDLSLITRGISLDNISDHGTSYINKSGPYDEVISGLGMYNTGLNEYVWNKDYSFPATPQILIFKTRYLFQTGSDENILNISKEDSLIERIIGANEIQVLSNSFSEIIYFE